MSVLDDVRVPPVESTAATRVAPAADPPRPRTGGGLWSLPPWRRAPFLPFGQPAVLLAVLAAAAILACAAASAPLFLSSASSAALQRLVGEQCPAAGTAAVKEHARGIDLPELDRRVAPAMTGAGLAPPALSALSNAITSVGAPEPITNMGAPAPFRVVYRAGALDHVTPLPGVAGGRGVWLSGDTGTRLAPRPGVTVRPGATIRVGGKPVRLAGYYRDFYAAPLPSYWCSYGYLVLPLGVTDGPPPLVLATDPQTFTHLAGGDEVDYDWVSPVDPAGLTATRGHDVADRQRAAYAAAGLPEVRDFGRTNGGSGQLPALTDRAVLIRDGLRGPVLPIALGGTLLALLLVGAAGSYWADRRFAEVRLLSARGVGPGALAGKAVLELVLPAVAGTVLGALLARWLVGLLGPSPDLDPGAYGQAAAVAGGGLVAGLALLGLVAGIRARNATERPIGSRRSRLVLVPWELALLGGAAATYAALRGGRSVTVVQNIAQVNLLVVLFPLLFILGGSVLAVRLLTLLLPVLSGRAGRLPAAWYLAARRLTAARVAAVVLLAAAATPIAISVYAAGLTSGSEQTLEAKARLFTGADVAVAVNDHLTRNAATDRMGTIVTRYNYGKLDANTPVAVLAVDPDTLLRTAYWREEFAGRSFAALLATLTGPAPDGRVPAIVVDPRGELGPTADIQLSTGLGVSEAQVARVAEVATATLFPGRRLPYPMVIVARSELGAVDPHAGSTDEIWTNGPAGVAQTEVAAQDKLIFTTVDQALIFSKADYLGITWTFGYLTALAGLVGLVSVGALLLYVETRQRSRTASYALGRRMGLSRATHLRSLLAELGLLLGVAYAVGVGLGRVGLGLVHGLLDVDPARPPTPLLILPTRVLLGALVATVVVAVLTALYAQRVADRAHPSDVLRLGS
ncbi:MAG TPA: hypothetical protein VI357_18275 [Mycobacteriales bacterium]